MILISKGDIKDAYEIIDAIFAVDANTKTFLSEVESGQAFEGVKQQLRERCRTLGGHAVINCRFEYRNALTDGFLGKKQTFEIFGYGTAVRLLDPALCAEVEAALEPWKERARSLLAQGKKTEVAKNVREHTNRSLSQALELVSIWEKESNWEGVPKIPISCCLGPSSLLSSPVRIPRGV